MIGMPSRLANEAVRNPSTMSAQPVGVLVAGAEPPWLYTEPRSYWVRLAAVTRLHVSGARMRRLYPRPGETGQVWHPAGYAGGHDSRLGLGPSIRSRARRSHRFAPTVMSVLIATALPMAARASKRT